MFRYSFSVLLCTFVLLSGRGEAAACPAGFRAFTHAMGESCIPTNPTRIVTTRGDKLATPLLDIGAPLVGAGFRTDQGVTYLRGATDIFGADFVAASGVASVGDPNTPDLEAIAALEPDLIMLPGWQTDLYERLSLIAPTIVIPDNLPFLTHLEMVADAAGRRDAYADKLTAYEAKIADIRAQIGDPSAISVSRFLIFDGQLGYYPNWGAMDQVIRDIGFARPDVQAEATENLTLSLEAIQSFDADLMLASYAPRFGQTIDYFTTQWDEDAPFWRNLHGVSSGNLYWYERDIWVGYTFNSLDVVADALLLLTAGRFDEARP